MPAKNVFISYARSDQALVEKLLAKLRPLPVRVFSDFDEIGLGEDWQETLRSRLTEAEFFLVVVTPKMFESPWLLQELGAAWALKKRIVTIVSDPRLLEKLPFDLRQSAAVNVNELEKLEEVLKGAA